MSIAATTVHGAMLPGAEERFESIDDSAASGRAHRGCGGENAKPSIPFRISWSHVPGENFRKIHGADSEEWFSLWDVHLGHLSSCRNYPARESTHQFLKQKADQEIRFRTGESVNSRFLP
jgi:hypothetical protein